MIGLALGRFLKGTPWSTLMAFLGVTLGVTSIVSVHLISQSVSTQLDALIPQQLSSYSHFLHRADVSAADYFSLRRSWRAGKLPQLERLSPVIDETVDLDGQAVRVIGIDLFAAGAGTALRADSQPGESFSWHGVWVDASLKDRLSVHVNGVINVPPGTLVADIGVAQDILGWSASKISYVGVEWVLPWRDWVQAVERYLPGFGAGFAAPVPALPALSGWDVTSLAQQYPASQFGKSVLFNISALGLLALLVAWFLIYQVAVSWLRRLWPVFERLHVLGVYWRTLNAYFVAALVSLGGIAAVCGLLLGRALAAWLYQQAVDLPAPAFDLDRWVVSKAALSAVGVCFVGGFWAFRQAQTGPNANTAPLWLAAVLLLLAAYGVLQPASGLAGGFLSIAVLSMLAVLFIAPLLRRSKRLSPLISGPYLARLSAREAIWYPQDMGVALAGLILAVATAVGVGLMVDSFREDFARMLERRLSYDLVAEGEPRALSAMNGWLAKRETTRVQTYRDVELRVGGIPMSLTATRLDAQELARYGHAGAAPETGVLLSEQGARALGLGVGDAMPGVPGEVLRVFSSFGDVTPRMIVDRSHPLAARAQRLDSINLTAPDPERLLREAAQRFPELRLRLQTELRKVALDTFDQTFAITTVLIVLAMLVASIGIYVAVTAIRLNKRTQSELMTGLGVNRWELVGMDFALGFGIGAVAVLMALPLGVAFGWILCAVVNPRAFGWTVELQFSWTALAQPALWGLAAAACAGLLSLGRREQRAAYDTR